MTRLAHKTALITGGTSGIGLETARQFIAEGARVAVTGSSEASIAAARAELGDAVIYIQADAGDVRAQAAVAETVKAAFGRLDVLFVNAGKADFRPLDAWDEAAFDASVAINVKGPYFLIQALLPLFSDRASVILNTSINAHIGMATSSVYALTKAALQSLIRTLSGELIGRGIRVNAVSPGPIVTPLHTKLTAGLPDAEAKAVADGIAAQIPLGRFGQPSEVAKIVVLFASDEAPFVVGSELTVDGGMSTL
ncbi:SDR family oxidoreductase [Asticcacaulis sp. YBE204]|uniref:SDR family oxidoreductase n=1 Tax=Asticcacaulis sp. YBE204 TaxID=1282363 RepID=UPI0003C3E10F|nr:SDR family oxidoreductase [Asticcacaulis sp. YBE204]ESQ79008.1 short-chain dehydrogenase [Asticcacaulis sp. YBE204]